MGGRWESLATEPESPAALEATGESCAEVVTIFDEGVPSTVPAQIIPTWGDRDDECSVSSDSCWGEQEDLIGDESVEWGLLPEVQVPDEDGSTAPQREVASQRMVQASCIGPTIPGGTPQSAQDVHGSQAEFAVRSPRGQRWG